MMYKHALSLAVKTFKKPLVLFLLLALVATGLAGYLYYQNNTLTTKLNELQSTKPQDNSAVENKELISKVGSLIELPTDESPTIATVTDKDKLKDQPFFNKSENGDRVLVYTSAKKAILYRPSTNKVIDIAPINIGDQKIQLSPTPTKRPVPKPTAVPTDSPSPTP